MAKSDIVIAREASMQPIMEVGAKLGIPSENLIPYGHTKAKIGLDYIKGLNDRPNGKLILVTAISPTPAGEGKTTTTIGLGDALNRIGKKTTVCIREPSLGPCFGMKGGAAGGGYAQVVPMEDINLHFTGDMHAIGAAHNLLAAMIDNYVHWGNDLRLDLRRVTWRRVVDINDRQLRQVVTGVGGPGNGFPMEGGFDITVASEIMAIFCLVTDLDDLHERLGKIVIGYTRDKEPVTAAQMNAPGAMTALLKDALAPNLVQTLENNPAFIHGGPFANIAHGCNTLIATQSALKLSDYVITEAGFGADLGSEKFFNIKCRKRAVPVGGSLYVCVNRPAVAADPQTYSDPPTGTALLLWAHFVRESFWPLPRCQPVKIKPATLSRLRRFFPKHCPQHLADIGFWQLLPEFDLTRDFVGRHVLATPLFQVMSIKL